MKKTIKSAHGFTLLELLVVVLIIGILAAIALPQYRKAVVRSKYASLKVMTKALANAQEAYYLANGKYAFDFDELDIDGPFVGDAYPSPTDAQVLRKNTSFGWCVLSKRHDRVGCTNSSIEMSYFIRGNHLSPGIDSVPGSSFCRVENGDTTSVQAKVCASETGKTAETQTADYQQWNY